MAGAGLSKVGEVPSPMIHEICDRGNKTQYYLDVAKAIFVIIDVNGKLSLINKMGCEVLGYEESEIIGKDWFENFVPQEERREMRAVLGELFRGKRKSLEYYESTILTKSGEERIIAWHNVGLTDGQDEIIAVLSSGEDITGHRQAQEALRESEQKYMSLIRNIPAVVFKGYADWSIDFVDGKIEELTGYKKEEFNSRRLKWNDVIFPEDVQGARGIFIKALKENKPYIREYRIKNKAGKVLWIQARGQIFCDLQGRVEYVDGVFFDITSLKQAEESFKNLFFNSPMGIFIIQNGKFKLVNPGFQKITGYTKKELIGKDCAKLISPEFEQKVRENAIKMLKDHAIPPFEFKIITKGGETKWVMETVASTQYNGEKAVLGYFMDIDQHKQLENQFIHAQKMEAVGRLAGGVAHDFNNLLMSIMCYGDMIKSKLREADPLYKYTEEIFKASKRAISLTRQLLAFSSKQILQPQVFNLNEVVRDIEEMLRRLIGEDIDLVNELDPELKMLKADVGQIEQVVMNLAVNARDAMPHGGKLLLKTANCYLEKNYAREHAGVKPGPYVCLTVSDNGLGMDAKVQSRIFEPFFTTKEASKGTGLGLSTVYGIVKQTGSHIEVCSKPGKGTTFRIYFPQVEGTHLSVKATAATRTALHGLETILVAEDDVILRSVISASLRSYGYEVLEARHGIEALQICETHPGVIHLLVTDVVMPMMGGSELVRRMAQTRPDLKVLYMSGYAENCAVHPGKLKPETNFLQKPFDPTTLAQKVREILDTHPDEKSGPLADDLVKQVASSRCQPDQALEGSGLDRNHRG